MLIVLFLVLLLLIVITWLMLCDRINAAESRLHWSAKQDWTALEQQIRGLTARVFELERQVEAFHTLRDGAKPEPVPAPVQVQAEPTTVTEAPQVFVTRPVHATEPAPRTQEEPAPILPSPVFAAAPAKASLTDRLRQAVGDKEWETLVAGSVMNKVGALILVIGIALFLGYSFRFVNPAGRSAIAALVSAGILTGGTILERRQQYRLFSRGLIGAGWAALYLTAYAMFALPAARVISSPFAGSVLLLAVGAGMVAHSLRYRVQAITAVAYFSAFAALAATPSTPFAVASLVPLAASLLYFARRFEWHAMALFGLFATWLTCISRGNANAPLAATTGLFITYWLLFESFDILRSRRGARAACLTWIFPVNTIAFLALAYRTWHTNGPVHMWRMAALSAVLFLLSSVLRIVFRPPDVGTSSQDPFDRIRKGTYEAPLGMAAVLAGLAILGRSTGFWTNVALAFEAEILYLAGIRFRSRFLRGLGRSGFTASLLDIWATASYDSRMVTTLGVQLHNWVPSVAVHVVLFYLNRFVWRATTVFSFAATALVAFVIYSELGPHTAPIGLFVFALLLFEFALRKSLRDIRIQSYLAASAGTVLELWAGGFAPHAPALIWVSSAMSGFAFWLFTGRILFLQPDRLSQREAARVRDLFAVAGSGFALLTLWMLLPGPLTAAAWTALALVFIALASVLNRSSFRWLAAGILGMAYARLLGFNLTSSWATQNVAERWLIPLFVVGAMYFAWHAFRRIPDPREQLFAPVFTWFALVPALWLLVLEVNRFYVASAWAAVAVALLLAGLQMRLGAFRWQSYCVAAMTVISCILINLAESGRADTLPRILGSSLLIVLLFAAEFLLPRDAVTLGSHEKHARSCYSIAATLLLIFVLYREVSGGLLTVAWGLQALACLGIGFPARERMLRLQGLAVFALCILKLFLYDLRNLETIYRILSFTALGAILLGVSWVYTRFRTQIRRYL